ncbi:MAG TPA: hypothetical protein H9839_10295 [Candidatus Intestinimonas stercorigallinarum]|nr:hypothetical protein [Candidatus Intestinimonas stercorigallinarum]
MERYTRRGDQGWQVPEGQEQAALERLAGLEDAYEELQGALALLEAQMEPLRAAGKQKSARFRELMGERLLLRRMLELLERHGLS